MFVPGLRLILASRCECLGPESSARTFCMSLSGSLSLTCFSWQYFCPSCCAIFTQRQEAVHSPVHLWLLLVLARPSVFLFHCQVSILCGHLLQGGVGCCDMVWSSTPAVSVQSCSVPALSPLPRWGANFTFIALQVYCNLCCSL